MARALHREMIGKLDLEGYMDLEMDTHQVSHGLEVHLDGDGHRDGEGEMDMDGLIEIHQVEEENRDMDMQMELSTINNSGDGSGSSNANITINGIKIDINERRETHLEMDMNESMKILSDFFSSHLDEEILYPSYPFGTHSVDLPITVVKEVWDDFISRQEEMERNGHGKNTQMDEKYDE